MKNVPSAKIVFYKDHESPVPIGVEDLPWTGRDGEETVVGLFSEHERTDCAPCPGKTCTKKFSLAFSPAVPREGTTRGDKNTDWVSLLVFDFDCITMAELEGVCDRLEGLESLLYSTHSHKPPDSCCVRIVLPLAQPLTPAEYKVVHLGVRLRYGLEWKRPERRPGEKDIAGADRAAKDISRLYFMPTSPVGEETLIGHEEGALLDLDDLLKNAAKPVTRLVEPEPIRVPSPTAAPVDMGELSKALRGYNPRNQGRDADEVISRKELVRRAAAGEPLVKPDEKGQRERSCHRLGTILAYCLPEGTSKAAMKELVRTSIMSMPQFEDDGDDDTIDARFAKLEYSFDRGLEERALQKRAFEAEKAKDTEVYRRMKKKFHLKSADEVRGSSSPPPPPPPPGASGTGGSPPPSAPPADDEEEELDWERFLITETNKDGSTKLKNVSSNVHILLAHSPEWRGVLQYNEITKDVVVEGGPLDEDYENSPAQITTGVSYWMQFNKGIVLNDDKIMAAILHTAKMRSYNPLQDYLNGLVWDGVPRIDTFLEEYCGAKTVDGAGADITDHIRRISRRWLVSAIARAMDPGCKVDTVLILEGDQGIKKSTLLKVIGGEWFADSAFNIADKDAKLLACQNWLVEMPELSALHASQIEAQKAFFSSATDKFRPPYGRTIESFPRYCIFVGSTNDERYMNDITGNRRYWPANCTQFQIRKLRRDRDQLLAESVTVYKAGFRCIECLAQEEGKEDRCVNHRWWLDQEENKTLEKVNNQRLKNNYADAIRGYILSLDITKRPTTYTTYEVATEILKLPADRAESQQNAIGRALKSLGFERRNLRIHGTQTWIYEVPELLRRAPKAASGRGRLHVVPDVSDPSGTP